MTQCCSIPLVWCDYRKSVLKAADTHRKETPGEHKEKGDSSPSKCNESEQPVKIPVKIPLEVCTSSRARTVIDYKQFLEEFADEPPSPLKKKCDVDLKCRPSKQCIVADKYKSKFVTKPTHLPRPVRHKANQKKITTGSALSNSMATPAKTDTPTLTVLTPATSSETRDAIEALLMLGYVPITDNRQLPEDDNALLVPILGTRLTPDNYVPV